MGWDTDNLLEEASAELICLICQDVMEDSSQITCGHAYCYECISEYYKQQLEDSDSSEEDSEPPRCPTCRIEFNKTEITPNRVARSVINKLKIRCHFYEKGCTEELSIGDLETHKIACRHNPEVKVRCNGGCEQMVRRLELDERNHDCERTLQGALDEAKTRSMLISEQIADCRMNASQLINAGKFDLSPELTSIIAFGGPSLNDGTNVEVVTLPVPIWNVKGARLPFPKEFYHFASCTVVSDVFIIGGIKDKNTRLKSNVCWDLNNNQCELLPGLPEPLAAHKCLHHDGQIIVTGGYNNVEYVRNIRRYSIANQTWSESRSKMNFGRASHTMTKADDHGIFLIGGKTANNKLLDSVEIYDANTDRVTKSSASLPIPLGFHDSVTLKNSIYVVAGSIGSGDDLQPHEKVYRLDPREGKWATVAPMNKKRCAHCVVVADGKIYALGGSGDDESTLKSVEEYSPMNNKWIELLPMTQKRAIFGVAVFPPQRKDRDENVLPHDLLMDLLASAAQTAQPTCGN